MRIGVLSDVHGNLEALEAVLRDADKQSIEKLVCLGDIVGYGANPVECLRIMRKRKMSCVAGNHDRVVLDFCAGREVEDMNSLAFKGVLYSAEKLHKSHLNFLKKLPYTLKIENLLFAHANIHCPEEFDYLDYKGFLNIDSFSGGSISKSFEFLENGQRLFIGHTHTPFRITNKKGFLQSFGALSFAPIYGSSFREYEKVICNVGSVGQPRDEIPKACYVVYDSIKDEAETRRVEYNVEKAGRKIEEAGLPKELASRLRFGE